MGKITRIVLLVGSQVMSEQGAHKGVSGRRLNRTSWCAPSERRWDTLVRIVKNVSLVGSHVTCRGSALKEDNRVDFSSKGCSNSGMMRALMH